MSLTRAHPGLPERSEAMHAERRVRGSAPAAPSGGPHHDRLVGSRTPLQLGPGPELHLGLRPDRVELCTAGGLAHIRRTVRWAGGKRVSESPWLPTAEAMRLWDRLLAGDAL